MRALFGIPPSGERVPTSPVKIVTGRPAQANMGDALRNLPNLAFGDRGL